MPSKPPVIFPSEQRRLSQLGERLKLARLRRKMSCATVAGRAGISLSSVYRVEAGHPGATLGTYLRVMATMALDSDFDALGADEHVRRKLESVGVAPPVLPPRRKRAVGGRSVEPERRVAGTQSGSGKKT